MTIIRLSSSGEDLLLKVLSLWRLLTVEGREKSRERERGRKEGGQVSAQCSSFKILA